MGDAAERKRDCGLDTKAMAEFGRSLFDFDWNLSHSEDVSSMNDGKIGHPFVYSDALIRWIVLLRTVLKTSYRLILGIANHHIESAGLPPISLTQLYNRCASIDLNICSDERFLAFGTGNIRPKPHGITVALDATGMSLRKYGGWLSHRWDKKEVSGWIKLHVAVDVDTNEILAFVVTDETVGDITCTEKLMDLVMAAGHDVDRLLADAAYDSKDNWNRYTSMGIGVCINIRSPQLKGRFVPSGRFEVRSHGCMVRAKEIMRIHEIGIDRWKEENGYPMRWKVECTFSDLKRMLLDILRAKTKWNCVQETMSKVSAHNMYKSIRHQLKEE